MKAIISLTTIPSRLPYIGPTIESLKAQGPPVYVWIPREVKRTGDTFGGDLPDELDGCNVEVVEDKGPITKLLPALEMGADVILTADDDVVYGTGPSVAIAGGEVVVATGWADGLLRWGGEHQDTAFGYRGRLLRDKTYNNSVLVDDPKQPRQVHIITGTWGALYRKEFFSDGIFEEWETFPHADDLVVATHLKRQGVPRVVIPHLCSIHDRTVKRVDPLYDSNVFGKANDEGLEKLGWWECTL